MEVDEEPHDVQDGDFNPTDIIWGGLGDDASSLASLALAVCRVRQW